MKARDAAINRGFDRVESLSTLAQSCLDAVNEVEIDPAKVTATEIRTLATVAIDAISWSRS